ncbi:MAG: type I glyceraldehyde-3-phosphate dehydrogenase [Candidatus Eisenbacteria bacterium]|uniref:Glyceraldehyde-3-phosphate dehydrogenase n=1 Tax=Eiseniibacteriota bacterium TaxID=2212470 RepID=A0A948RT23_UNCEI|nr:type I glyceraldehyde-3-phosphate dehydrogenase [Candidatus Eisenbacteria bacterium]MBU1947687.1 type I glyceraldehyde-3-phosphate dehydrogenase [Candidatus Eisenbacteria bacterium]MBU2689491.1 type I glyceraldehyde-3-phosphate dehydrogenase [Candidatus Eisenbacteria bacterium]
MKIRIAINGFGRIGRSVYRLLNQREDIEVLAINDIADNKGLAYLLKYDTVMGVFEGELRLEGDMLYAGRQKTQMMAIRDPMEQPWEKLGIDVVVEATGRFRLRDEVAMHLKAGARRVILTVPSKDEIDATVVIGVNEHVLKPEHRIVSNASCTTNCLAPIAMILDNTFGIKKGIMTTVHAYTNDQRLADVPHKDLRRSRAAAENIIPTTTGAAKAVGKVLPNLAGKLDGIAMRVPVPNGSIVDLVVELNRDATVEDVNTAVKTAAEGPLKRVLEYTEEPIVSSDVIGNPHSSIFDGLSTRVLPGGFVKVLSWYDNEWGYANRVIDLIECLDKLGPPLPEKMI